MAPSPDANGAALNEAAPSVRVFAQLDEVKAADDELRAEIMAAGYELEGRVIALERHARELGGRVLELQTRDPVGEVLRVLVAGALVGVAGYYAARLIRDTLTRAVLAQVNA